LKSKSGAKEPKNRLKLISGIGSWLTWMHHHLMELLPDSWVHVLKKLGTKRVNKAANDLDLKDYSRK